MADDTELNAGSGGDIIATDDIGGVKYQRVKMTLGDDGTNDGDVSSANPIPVLPPNPLPVSQVAGPTTGAITSVGGSITNVTLLASNASRRGAAIYNDSNARLYVKLGATASTSSYTKRLAPYESYEIPFGYTGIIDGIWAPVVSGNARVTELT